MNDRLYRSVDDRVIAGVCGGLAVRLDIDPSLIRIAYVIGALLTGVFPLLVLYVIMAAVIPEEPTGFAGVGRSPTPPGPDAVPGWVPPGAASAAPTGAWPPSDASTGAWPPAPEGTSAAMPEGAATAAAVTTAWPAVSPADGGSVDPAATTGTGAAQAAPAPGAAPGDGSQQAWWTGAAPAARSDRHARRRSADPLLAVVGGLALVALGVYFLVRDRLDVDWGVVWAAGIVAVGIVVVLAALRPRS